MHSRKGVLTRFHVKGVSNDKKNSLGALCTGCNGDQLCDGCKREEALRHVAIRYLTSPESPHYDRRLAHRGGDRQADEARNLKLRIIAEFVERLRAGLPGFEWLERYQQWVVLDDIEIPCPVVMPVRLSHCDSDAPEQVGAIYRALSNGVRRRTKEQFGKISH